MAGYLITMNDRNGLIDCIRTGTYSTLIKPSGQSWLACHEGTFADYLGMKEGDQVFFFIKRKIYGCGVLKKIGTDCKY